ncbi:MAG TPA: TetR/AcrR family transcriptional regulator C-terminal domain-containing protein [Actinomycetes bacterium]|nr:TetR/AcrR family transcriptional regulator C-terminal domain-containing protein [Actinomycetes bacterium]
MATRTAVRPTLSSERILDAALALIDSEGDASLTFRRLGGQLGADPTAVYRYFRNKDELLLALADRVIDRALDAIPENADWRQTLRSLAVESYRSLLLHPRLAILVAARTTQGEAEARAIERVLEALHRAGFSPQEAVGIWRAFADTMLAWAGLSAAFLSLPVDTRAKDVSAWTHSYQLVSADQFPHLHRAGPYLADAEVNDPFHLAVEIMLDGIAARLSPETGAK